MRRSFILFVLGACKSEGVVKTVTNTVTETVTITVPVEETTEDTGTPPEDTGTEQSNVLYVWFDGFMSDYIIFPNAVNVGMGRWYMMASEAGSTIHIEERKLMLFASEDANILIGDYNPAAQWNEPLPLTDYLIGCEMRRFPDGVQIAGPSPLNADGSISFTNFEVTSVPTPFDLLCAFDEASPAEGVFYGFALREMDPIEITASEAGSSVPAEVRGHNGTPDNPDVAAILYPTYFY